MRTTHHGPTATDNADDRAADRAGDDVDVLAAAAPAWARMPLVAKRALLAEVVDRTLAEAPAWVEAACLAKGIPEGSPLAGEEWISGPWALIACARAYLDTLDALVAGEDPLDGIPIRVRGNGQLVLDVFPATVFDRLLLSSYRAEVWMEPGITTGQLADHVAPAMRHTHDGRVAVVLGAGNISSIPPLDLLHQLFVKGNVAIVKLNPVNDYLGAHLEAIFASFVDAGYVRFAHGGADVGAALCHRPEIGVIHLTGSAATHDAVVFGSGAEGAARRAAGTPSVSAQVTSELGGVGAAIIVPGPWDDTDLRQQAANLATMKLHNAGCNCIALQLMVLPASWELTERLVDEVARCIRSVPPRPAYYPGAADRLARMVGGRAEVEQLDATSVPRSLVRELDPSSDDRFFDTEAFGTALATTRLEGDDPAEFLDRAVAFCNDRLAGSLGIQILVHPHTAAELGHRLDAAIERLRYGTIAVNCWSGVGYLLPRTPWGAHPGHSLAEVGSGIGVVHNALMLEGTQKTVVHGPFRTFPSSIAHGDLHLATTPPWFVTHRRAATLGRRLTAFAADPRWTRLPGLFVPALRG